MKIKGEILFREVQYFRIKWVWWLIILCSLGTIGGTVALGMTEREQKTEAWMALAFVIPFEAAFLYLIYITRLETIISNEGVFYKWWPFQRSHRFISKEEIKSAQLRNAPALNYGFHWLPGYGRVHNMAQGKGIQFILKNGRKVFLGTQKKSAFQTALEKIVTVSRKE